VADLWQGILNPSHLLVASRESGCLGCPLEKQRKVMGWDEVLGRRVMVWGQSPGKDEIAKGAAFVGRSGRFLWRELARVGLTRDQCDVQNVLRCRPSFRDEAGLLRDREPEPNELKHCSVYNDVALRKNGGKAVLHIVLGRVAARQLLPGEYDPDIPFLWSKRLSAWVVCLDHPSYFLRGAPRWRMEQFRRRLAGAVRKLDRPGRWDDIRAMAVHQATPETLEAMAEQARRTGHRVAVDVEDERTEDGRRLLCVGFSLDGKSALVAPVDYPGLERDEALIRVVRAILADKSVRKTMHYGAYDCEAIRGTLRVDVAGYDFDTQHAHYLTQPHRRAHGLEVIAAQEYPEFTGWKEMVSSHYKRLSEVPWKTLRRYNGLDCILTKRVESGLSSGLNPALVNLYVHAGRTLYRMESVGPHLDMQALADIRPRIRAELADVTAKLRRIADDPQFSPSSNVAVARLLYDKLGYQADGGRRGTDSDTLSILRQGRDHPAIGLILRFRELSKMESTYLDGYEESARMNAGQVRTRWYLTGAVTGRLRSGGDGQPGRINMQNLHGSPHLQNLLVADPEWRSVIDPGRSLSELSDVRLFLSLDYSQIEIRMLAECSGDELLISQFRQGLDIHCAVGHALDPKLSHEEIKKNKALRTFIKNCHFGMVYGLSEDGLLYYLQTRGVEATKSQVSRFVRRYFSTYKGVARYIQEMRRMADEVGFVETIFGFRRYVGAEYDEDRKSNPANQAVNSPIQGAAHTLLLQALALLSEKAKRYRVLGTPLMEVHDAIVWGVALRDLPEAVVTAKRLLEQDVPAALERRFGRKLRVPLLSEATAGFRYGTQVEVGAVVDVADFLERWKRRYDELDADYRRSYKVT